MFETGIYHKASLHVDYVAVCSLQETMGLPCRFLALIFPLFLVLVEVDFSCRFFPFVGEEVARRFFDCVLAHPGSARHVAEEFLLGRGRLFGSFCLLCLVHDQTLRHLIAGSVI